VYFPPKFEMNLQEAIKVLKLAYKYQFIDILIVNQFLNEQVILIGSDNFEDFVINRLTKILDKIQPVYLINQLNSYYDHFALDCDTGFLLWTVLLLKSKERFSEMLAVNHAKLPDSKTVLDRIKNIILKIKDQV